MNAELDKIKSGSSAVILCGGKSTRMAQDKAGLLIGKKTFLQQIEKNLKDADEILLSVKDRRDYPEIGARHIEDQEADKGPNPLSCRPQSRVSGTAQRSPISFLSMWR